jgi:hypothetical protein
MAKLVLALLATGCTVSGYDAIVIEAGAPIELEAFSQIQLRAYGVHDDGSREDITDLVRWRSTNPAAVTVGDTGVATWADVGTSQLAGFAYELAATVHVTAREPGLWVPARDDAPLRDDGSMAARLTQVAQRRIE